MSLYVLKNKKPVLVTKVVINRKSVFRKAFGLMFHKKIFDEAHIFHFKKSRRIVVTMFFVFFPIDIIFIKNEVVVEIKKNLKPFSNFAAREKADKFIELPAGFIEKYEIFVGSNILVK